MYEVNQSVLGVIKMKVTLGMGEIYVIPRHIRPFSCRIWVSNVQIHENNRGDLNFELIFPRGADVVNFSVRMPWVMESSFVHETFWNKCALVYGIPATLFTDGNTDLIYLGRILSSIGMIHKICLGDLIANDPYFYTSDEEDEGIEMC